MFTYISCVELNIYRFCLFLCGYFYCNNRLIENHRTTLKIMHYFMNGVFQIRNCSFFGIVSIIPISLCFHKQKRKILSTTPCVFTHIKYYMIRL